MDALIPGHAHKSSSDRLLNNYLNSQKNLSTSLLNLLSHSHSSTSSLLAYVTSSPGVVPPVRRAVRHAAFEGPLSTALTSNPDGDHASENGDVETQGWAAYLASLDGFRKDLKQIHLLEEDMSRVKRDREILVSRLIKQTKTRPSKSDLSALASQYHTEVGSMSSRASMRSMSSTGTATSKEGKRAGKLADAQAELLGCEEHLRSLEIRIEQERNKVMTRGLEDRFRAMEAVGRMWVAQAKAGLFDLEKVHELPPDAFELDSNPSIAPSQSASQVAYEDHPAHKKNGAFPLLGRPLQGPGSIAGSIAEEEEGSSEEEDPQNLVLHENRPLSPASANPATTNRHSQIPYSPVRPSPLGVPSANTRVRPLSSANLGKMNSANHSDSDSDAPNRRAGGRRAASDVGAMGYRPPQSANSLRRTHSHEHGHAGSDRSSVRSVHRVKKRGFFASFARLFKSSKRSGRESPPYGSGGKGAWHTRTDSNIKRTSAMYRSGHRGTDDSSSDEDTGNYVSVSNNRAQPAWSAEQVGRPTSRASKRNSKLPVANGLIPDKPVRADLKRNSSQATITGLAPPRAPSRAGTATPTPGMTRSNTVKSVASVRTQGTVKSSGTAKKTRPNGAIARSASLSGSRGQAPTIMSLVDMKTPQMPEVPKAPKSHVTPQMELATAPGSSLVKPDEVRGLTMNVQPAPHKPGLTKSHSVKSVKSTKSAKSAKATAASNAADDDYARRSTTPLPPSRLLSPPLKSALRPTSPTPVPTHSKAKPYQLSAPIYAVSAPGPVELPEEELQPVHIPSPAPKPASTAASTGATTSPGRPIRRSRNSYSSATTDGQSVYESAVDDTGAGTTALQHRTDAGAGADETSDEEEEDDSKYRVVDNERVKRLGINVGPPEIERIPSDTRPELEYVAADDASQTSEETANHRLAAAGGASDVGSNVTAHRKSVRMAVPDSPTVVKRPGAETPKGETFEDAQTGQDDVAVDHEEWNTRIGKMREDTSDESDHDDDYLAARKGLIKNTGKWALVKDGAEKKATGKKSKSDAGSVKSKASRTSKTSRVSAGRK